jgi:hypothetical protein
VKRPAARTVMTMTQTDKLVCCVECERRVRETEAKDAGWFYWSAGADLHLVCALCAAQRIAADADAPTDG